MAFFLGVRGVCTNTDISSGKYLSVARVALHDSLLTLAFHICFAITSEVCSE